MVKKIAFFAIPLLTASLMSCLGEDPNVKSDDAENTVAMCTDGEDNDGDYNYDCYDSDCRALDSTRRSHGDSIICPYEKYTETINRDQSSFLDNRSSSKRSSSSVAPSSYSTGAGGFPYVVDSDDADDSIQVMSLFRKKGSSKIVLTGRMRQHGLYAVIDTTGAEQDAFTDVRTTDEPPGSMSTDAGTMIGATTIGLDTNAAGDYVLLGSSIYQNRTFASFFSRSGNTGAWNIEFWWKEEFVFTGFMTTTTKCFVTNSADTAFAVADENLTDKSIPYAAIHKLNTHFVAGALDGEECLAVGTRTVTDSSQIWFGRIDKHNNVVVEKQIGTGSADEKAYAVTVSGSNTYLAVRVDGEPRLLVVDDAGNVSNSGSTQALGVGIPYRVKPIKVGSTTRILMVGTRSGQGMLWLLNSDGGVYGSQTISSVEAFTDVIQLGDGTLLVSGWKSATGGTGTVGIVEHISTNLTLIE